MQGGFLFARAYNDPEKLDAVYMLLLPIMGIFAALYYLKKITMSAKPIVSIL